ncbi:unnamed protein product [Protopolystoma xenopodis]|uniref:Uncharacterized protein n=1 Tax=Protopolystoma xenopodis TaxID=117903 RepID=A0A3S5AP89_9PLAT|nr:unnamed protein product [Protopolystoma xenopodis]
MAVWWTRLAGKTNRPTVYMCLATLTGHLPFPLFQPAPVSLSLSTPPSPTPSSSAHQCA